MTHDRRAGAAGALASGAVVIMVAGLILLLHRGGVFDGRQPEWLGWALFVGVPAFLAFQAWLWFRLFRWFDLLLGGNGH